MVQGVRLFVNFFTLCLFDAIILQGRLYEHGLQAQRLALSVAVFRRVFFLRDQFFEARNFGIEPREVNKNARPYQQHDDENDIDWILREEFFH
jgi:hypothetical protein